MTAARQTPAIVFLIAVALVGAIGAALAHNWIMAFSGSCLAVTLLIRLNRGRIAQKTTGIERK